MRQPPPVHAVRDLPQEPAHVWAAVTGPDLLSRWFTPTHRTADGHYVLTFHEDGGAYAKRFVVSGCSQENGSAKRAFHGRLEDPGYPDSTVSVHLSPHGTGTRIELTHHDPPARLTEGYRTGWPGYLDALARHLHG